MIPIVVFALKYIFALLIKRLVVLRRHKYEVNRIKWEIIIITLYYLVVTGFIKWIIYRSFSIFGIHIELLTIFLPFLNQLAKIMPIRPDKIHLYHEYNKEWIAHASHKVIIIAIFSYNLAIFLYHLLKQISRKCSESSAEKKPTQKKMN